MARGRVKSWNGERQTGRIVDRDDGTEMFFCGRDLRGLMPSEIQQGLEVEYERGQGDRGPLACNIRRASDLAATLTTGGSAPSRRPSQPVAAVAQARRGNTTSNPPEGIPVPHSLQRLLASGGIPDHEFHPGLRLDKFLQPCRDQKQQREILDGVAKLPGDGSLLAELRRRRDEVMRGLDAETWHRRTSSRLTLHLARASALENAGLCLHPLYGFVYIPGTGLKGLARAYAETVWIASLPIAEQARGWQRVESIFGWAPGSDLIEKGQLKPWRPRQVQLHDEGDSARAGSITFHDAWPTSWPSLIVDIVNNHHFSYYQGDGPPGDWDSPNPVYFLAVPAGQEFAFAIDKRRDDVPDQDLRQAREWLDGGLTHLGCGAKTAAGYGRFAPAAAGSARDQAVAEAVRSTWSGALAAPAASGGIPRVERSSTLTLVTPAFLAGADQEDKRDCELRPATLRGLLRWWWRTLHAGYLGVKELKQLEAWIWGDTDQGGAVQIALDASAGTEPVLFNHRDRTSRFVPDPDFERRHQLEKAPHKTTQGLFYVSFGMDEKSKDVIKQRHYLDDGGNWELRLTARAVRAPVGGPRADIIPADRVLEQAVAALDLLCAFGGVGSKGRKGFGSLQVVSASASAPVSIDDLQERAAAFRRLLGWDQTFSRERLESPSLANAIQLDSPIATPWSDPWTVLDRIGFAYQAFMQQKKHNPEKVAMGLPRKIHGPNEDGPIRNKRTGALYQDAASWRPPQWLDFKDRPANVLPKDARYGSPVHIHVAREPEGLLTVRAIAFPAGNLPDFDRSEQFLRAFLDQFRDKLEDYTRRAAPRSAPRGPQQRRTAPPAGGSSPSNLPKPKDAVDCKLLSERTKKGGWKAIHEPSGFSGPVVDSDKISADKQPGEIVRLTVASVNEVKKEMTFKTS